MEETDTDSQPTAPDNVGGPTAPAAPKNRTAAAVLACIVATAALTGVDLWSKAWAVDNLSAERTTPVPVCEGRTQRVPSDEVVLVEEYLRLAYAENCGAAFSLMKNQSKSVRAGVFGLAAIVASIVFMWMFWRGKGSALFAWSVPLVVSGAIGNLVDRMNLGYVVDFIAFRVNDWHYPTFNIADTTITIGIILFFLDGLRDWRDERRAMKEAALDGSNPEVMSDTDESAEATS